MTRRIGALAALALLAACATQGTAPRAPAQVAPGQPQANELTIDTMGGGHFRGRAGSAWTEAEVGQQASQLECGGRQPAALDIRPVAGGGYSFTGRC